MKSSISRIKLFKACRRAYYFKYIEGLEPVEKADALKTGSSYHKLLEELYTNNCHWDYQDFSKERAMAEAYYKYIYPRFEIKAVEEWRQKDIGNHSLIGRIDGFSKDGCIVEHKTTSSEISEAYEYNLLWDEQILAYMYLTGSHKVYYTVCRKPTIRQKKNESDEEFFNRMLAWYDEDTDSKIKLLVITRTDEEIQRFVNGFEDICNDMESETNLYMNTQYCNCWGRRCEYSSICLNYNPDEDYIEFTKGGRK